MDTVIKRKEKWLGHIMRRNWLMLDAMEGKTEGIRKLGRRKKKQKFWMTSRREVMGMQSKTDNFGERSFTQEYRPATTQNYQKQNLLTICIFN